MQCLHGLFNTYVNLNDRMKSEENLTCNISPRYKIVYTMSLTYLLEFYLTYLNFMPEIYEIKNISCSEMIEKFCIHLLSAFNYAKKNPLDARGLNAGVEFKAPE